MAESDRSRSPAPGRNRAEPEPSRPPVRQDLPFFPRWCGPMQSAIWHSQQMLRPQSRPQFQPQLNMRQPGPYMTTTSMHPSASMPTWPNPRFPPTNPRFPPAPSFITTTNTCLSTSIQLCHSTMFTYDSMCPNSTGFAQYSINPVVTTSPFRHSILQVTRGTDNH